MYYVMLTGISNYRRSQSSIIVSQSFFSNFKITNESTSNIPSQQLSQSMYYGSGTIDSSY